MNDYKLRNQHYRFLLFIGFPLTSMVITCSPVNFSPLGLGMSSIGTNNETHTIEQTFDLMLQRAGCSDFRTHVWDYLHKLISMGNDVIYFDNFEQTIKERLQQLIKNPLYSQDNVDNFSKHFGEIYTLISNLRTKYQNPEDINNLLIQIEYGDRDNDLNNFIDRLKAALNNLEAEAKKFNSNCSEELDNPSTRRRLRENNQWNIEWFNVMKNRRHPVVYGAKKVMATAYQSCDPLDLPLMPSNHDTKGFEVTGQYRNTPGKIRAIRDLQAVNHSHYYISQMNIPNNSNNNQCLNIHLSPVLYDYGGKPATTSHSINLFKNAGRGGSVLGLDCSGFVTTALASAGLRLRYGTTIRPGHINAVSSWLLKEPKRRNFSCLEKQNISRENPLQPGDIIASGQHVVIVDQVANDPFSMSIVSDISQCHSRNIRDTQFKFSIIQSSPINSGVGINRMHFSEAAPFMASIRRGLQKTASRICYNTFGKNEHRRISEISILRHNSEESKCRQPEIHLRNQECLQFCMPKSI